MTPLPSDLAGRRRRYLGPSLRLSYDRPLHIVRGRAQFLTDADGRDYLDAVNNIAHVGHCHPRVIEALRRQASELNTNTRYLHEAMVAYAERLAALLPAALEVCYFVNSGSEANDLALRMARAHTGARDVVVQEGAYHGHTSALIDVSPYKFDGPGGTGAPAHVRVVPMPDVYRGRYRADDPLAARRYAGHVREALEERPGAAFLCEPVLGCGGQVFPPAGYLSEAFSEVRARGGLCITDEVQVGLGRLGSHFWGFERDAAVPDLVTLGKPLGNGHPLAAVVTTREIARSFDNGMEFFSSFGGNPVSCAVGLAVLDVLQEEELVANALHVGDHLRGALEFLAGCHPVLGDVRGSGLFLGAELVRDPDTREPWPEEAHRVVNRMREEGVLLSTDGPAANVLKIKPPMVFRREDADRLAETLDRVLREPPAHPVG